MIGTARDILPVDIHAPLVCDHPLNWGRTVWWLSLHAWAGSRHFYSLASNAGTGDKLGLLDMAVASPGGWVSSTRPGALGPAVRLSSADHDNIVSGTNGIGLISSNVITAAAGTLAIWVRPTDAAATSTHVYTLPTIAGDGNNQFWGLHYGIISGTDNIWAYGWDGAEKKVGAAYTLSKWVRAVWVHGGGNVLLYLNGVLAGSVACGSLTTMSSQFHVSTYTAGYFGGDVDDVAVWNRALSAAEVWLDYQESIAGYPNVLNRASLGVFSVGSQAGFTKLAGRGGLVAGLAGRSGGLAG